MTPSPPNNAVPPELSLGLMGVCFLRGRKRAELEINWKGVGCGNSLREEKGKIKVSAVLRCPKPSGRVLRRWAARRSVVYVCCLPVEHAVRKHAPENHHNLSLPPCCLEAPDKKEKLVPGRSRSQACQ